MPTTTVSTRLDPEEVKVLDALSESAGVDRASLLKSIVRRGMGEMRLEQSVAAYRQERVTLSRAAEMAGLGVWDLLARMDDVDLHYGVAEFEADLETLHTPS